MQNTQYIFINIKSISFYSSLARAYIFIENIHIFFQLIVVTFVLLNGQFRIKLFMAVEDTNSQ